MPNREDIYTYFKYFAVAIGIGLISGFLSFVFLISLDFISDFRIYNPKIIFLLPLAGLVVGYLYHYSDDATQNGNVAIIEEISKNTQKLTWKITPTIFLATLLTHLVGGSAGREGTAVQMSAGLSTIFKKFKIEQKIITKCAVAAGFASVFGTPLAGIFFSIEFWQYRKIDFKGIIPIAISAFVAHYFCIYLGANHSHYQITEFPQFKSIYLLFLPSILFGLSAIIFIYLQEYIKKLFAKLIIFPPFRPFLGGFALLLIYLFFNLKMYEGLGISTIQNAFVKVQKPEAFFLKIVLTSFTLAVGFKGGEVTPLFFIGACLGSALFLIVPLPLSFLAATGFVCVFAAATNTPIASIFLGFELFGFQFVPYLIPCCLLACLVSGKKSIYTF